MTIVAFFPCEKVIENDGNFNFIGFGLGGYLERTFPLRADFSIVVAFHGQPTPSTHIEMEVLNPANERIAVCPLSHTAYSEDSVHLITKEIKIDLPSPGTFVMCLNIDHITLATYPLVILGPEFFKDMPTTIPELED